METTSKSDKVQADLYPRSKVILRTKTTTENFLNASGSEAWKPAKKTGIRSCIQKNFPMDWALKLCFRKQMFTAIITMDFPIPPCGHCSIISLFLLLSKKNISK